MEKKKNIIYITGADTVSVEEELRRLEQAFAERQSKDNIHRYHLSTFTNWQELLQDTQTMGLFVEKRLFIFRGSIEREGRAKKKSSEKEEYLLRIAEGLDDETFLIFAINGEGTFTEWLDLHADKRVYNDTNNAEKWARRYPNLEENIVTRIISEYQKRIESYEEVPIDLALSMRESFEKLSLIRESRMITDDDIASSISLDQGGRIFDLVDAIMAGDAKKSLRLYHRIQDETTSFALLPSLISLMRGGVYTKYLKEKGYQERDIGAIVGAHPYVVKKSYQSRISWKDLHGFYDKILDANTAYRSGKGLHDPELGRIFAIERALMTLKK